MRIALACAVVFAAGCGPDDPDTGTRPGGRRWQHGIFTVDFPPGATRREQAWLLETLDESARLLGLWGITPRPVHVRWTWGQTSPQVWQWPDLETLQGVQVSESLGEMEVGWGPLGTSTPPGGLAIGLARLAMTRAEWLRFARRHQTWWTDARQLESILMARR